jgi:uncharacterized protein (UPF0335 family)
MKKTPMKETPGDREVKRAALENSGAALLAIVAGLEDKIARKADLADLIKADFDAAKSQGYDKTAVKRVIKMRGETDADREKQNEFGAIVATYWDALQVADGVTE